MMKYKELFDSIVREKFPDKLNDPLLCHKFDNLNSSINVIELNNILFHNGNREHNIIDSRLKSYTEEEIVSILKHQNRYSLSNAEVVRKYGMSRTTLSTWKKRFYRLLVNLD